jgi:cell division septation protein DedD
VPSAELPPGSFWQLMAVHQPEAEAMRQTLRDKGFPAMLSPGPNNLTRVLVGPFNDTQSFGKAKTDLENAGFQAPVRYRRD